MFWNGETGQVKASHPGLRSNYGEGTFGMGMWRQWLYFVDGCFFNFNFGVWLPDVVDDWPGKVIQG
jgi:hypothetical protein